MKYKVGFLGNWGLASELLNLLLESKKLSVEFVITQYDSNNTKDKWFNIVWNISQDHNLYVFNQNQFYKDENKLLNLLNKYQVDLLVSCAYRYIIGQKPISEMNSRMGIVNLHGSLLPKYRGPSPVVWAMINRDEEIGVTLHYMDYECDTGDIIFQSSVKNNCNYTLDIMTELLKKEGVVIFKKFLYYLENCLKIPRIKQDHTLASRAPRLKMSDLQIDFNNETDYVISYFNATQKMNPFFTYGKDLIYLFCVKKEIGSCGRPGIIENIIDNKTIIIGTIDGQLRVEIQKPYYNFQINKFINADI